MWACSSQSDERRLEQIQERGGRVILGVSWRFPGVVVTVDLGWVQLRTDRHRRALIYAGRLQGMEGYRWPRKVGEVLADKRGMGSGGDYVRALRDSYGLGEECDKEEWSGGQWKKLVVRTVREVACQDWREEVEHKVDI